MALADTLNRILGSAPPPTIALASRQDEAPPAASPATSPTPGEAGRVFRAVASVAEQRARREALEECEKTIRRHRKSWVDAGKALCRVQREQLYLDQTFKSFEEYIESRQQWIKPRQAWNYIRAAAVADNVAAVSHQLSLNAAVVLARLKPELQAECLSKAIAGCGSKSPTASYLSDVAASMLGRKSKPKKKRPKPMRYVVGNWVLSALPKAVGADPRELADILLRWASQLTSATPRERPTVGELV